MAKNHRLTYVRWAIGIFFAVGALGFIVTHIVGSINASIAADALVIQERTARIVKNQDYPDQIRDDFKDACFLSDNGQYSRAKKAFESILRECEQFDEKWRSQAETWLAQVNAKSDLLYEQNDLVQMFNQAEKLMGERRYKSASSVYQKILREFVVIAQRKEEQKAEIERLKSEAGCQRILAEEKTKEPRFRDKITPLFKQGEDEFLAGKYAPAKATFELVLTRCDEIDATEKRLEQERITAERAREQLEADAKRAHASAKKLFDNLKYRNRVSVDYEMGETLLGEGKFELAIQSFGKVVEGARLYDKELKEAADEEEKNRVHAEAVLTETKKLLANEDYAKTTMNADFASAGKLVEAKKYDRAVEVLEAIKKKAAAVDAEKLEAQRKYQAAKPLAGNALYSRLVQAEFQAGEGFLRTRDYPQAAERFAKVAEIAAGVDREKKEAEVVYANAKKLAEGAYADKVAAEFAAGEKFLKEGNYKLAAESFVKVEKIIDAEKKLAGDVKKLRAKIRQEMKMFKGASARGPNATRIAGVTFDQFTGIRFLSDGVYYHDVRITVVMQEEFLSGEKYAEKGDLVNAKRCFENVLNAFEAELKKVDR